MELFFPGHSLRDRVALAVNFNRTPTLSHINYDKYGNKHNSSDTASSNATNMGMVDN